MFRLHAIQAAHGDCLLLEYGTVTRRFILIDGGPPDTFQYHLRPVLQGIAQSGGTLDLVVLSHVDGDHVMGLLDYFAELRLLNHELPVPFGLWHNSFEATVDPHEVIVPRLSGLLTETRANVMLASGSIVQGVAEGANLRTQTLALNIPINHAFASNLISVENVTGPLVFDNLELVIVGPTQVSLDALEQDWIAWLNAHENGILSDDPFVMANSDLSVPNLSSIMFLARADGRTMLLTGDGRSDQLLGGLAQTELLDTTGRMYVDVLKLPHHGSDRNITKTFFRKVLAETYVASANGRDGNPDLATLIWLVEAAREQQRQIRIVETNRTPSVEKLLAEYPADQFNYSVHTLSTGEHAIIA